MNPTRATSAMSIFVSLGNRFFDGLEAAIQMTSRGLNWASSVLQYWAKRARKSNHIWFEGIFENWSDAEAHSQGYSADAILFQVLESTKRVIDSGEGFERDGVLFDTSETDWVFHLACRLSLNFDKKGLRVCDFGGALGSKYFQHRDNLLRKVNVKWMVIEQENFVAAGRQLASSPQLTFHSSVRSCSKYRPNLVILGSVLQYIENDTAILLELLALEPKVILLERHPASKSVREQIVVQHVPDRIYPASYPMKIFSDKALEKVLSGEYELLFETRHKAQPVSNVKGLQFDWISQVWVRKQISGGGS